MTIGLTVVRDEQVADRLHRMLLLPFVRPSGDYPLNRRGPEYPPSHQPNDGLSESEGTQAAEAVENEHPEVQKTPG